ncbi:aminotransferase class I/II-fold pyridoxal phosphate-dependent enzyme [Spirosoma endbachense]|uniref:Aminotransferase class I/II-fold pyridoxal phosphate-dependent enzyme n=1 Tax=Spirosoma endbachense TaxID=2666025 RepID=A0A6P1W5L6_9BACT|nr:pyridoxal phosphate-dependent aminotransferase family protein [Spirosoma endbachense]QHW00316.1 aminotransferase class I/II-fold pyridoxal phosphate-dependent enzyme [Spirosoma endbachense]
MSLLEKLTGKNRGLSAYGQYQSEYIYPILEGPLKSRMTFKGREVIVWSFNDYLGLQSDDKVIQAETEIVKKYGSGYPAGSRLLTGNTVYHEQLEQEISQLIGKDVLLLNFGYQGIMSVVDSLVDRHETIIYDQQVHASLIDGVRLHQGPKFSYKHNDIHQLERLLSKVQSGSEVLVLVDGVFSMRGDTANVADILRLKETYEFTLLVDDAHGFMSFGERGSVGDLMPQVDIYISTFAKALATTGGFVAARKEFIDYFKYNLRSQTFGRTLPLLTVASVLFKLKLLAEEGTERRNKLWKNTRLLQEGLKTLGYDIGNTCSPITPIYLTYSEETTTAFLGELRYTYRVFCSPVVYPVVPKGTLILRLIVTALHEEEDIIQTLDAFAKLQQTYALNSEPEYSEDQ